MQFMNNRYFSSGYFFLGCLILLLPQREIPNLLNIAGGDTVVSVIIGLAAGFPLGFIVYSCFQLYFYGILKGTGRFIQQRRLLNEVKNSIGKFINKSNEAEIDKNYLTKILNVLDDNNPNLFKNMRIDFTERDRVFYSLVWQSNAKKDFLDSCQRRWETYYVCAGSISGMILALLFTIILCVFNSWGFVNFIQEKWLIILFQIFVAILLYLTALMNVKQVSCQENIWIEFLISKIKSDPSFIQNILTLEPIRK